jgi:hypothetical protein
VHHADGSDLPLRSAIDSLKTECQLWISTSVSRLIPKASTFVMNLSYSINYVY